MALSMVKLSPSHEKNPADKLHYGKEVSLKIYDRMEIAARQSRYQIAEQPLFPRHERCSRTVAAISCS